MGVTHMHDCARLHRPCALPDGHSGGHRSPAGLASYRASQNAYNVSNKGRARGRRYRSSENGRDRQQAWMAANPVTVELSKIRSLARKREAA